MNANHHGKHGQPWHRPPDAFELYELEHMPRKVLKVSGDNTISHDFVRPHDLETFRHDYYDTGRAMQHYWRPQEDGYGGILNEKTGLGHGRQRHKPHDAFESYELEHMPQTFITVSSDRAKSHDLEAPKPDYYETERKQNYWSSPKDGDMGIYSENVDAEVEKFITSEHEKFEFTKWMSMKGY